jgi:hypothetical protein
MWSGWVSAATCATHWFNASCLLAIMFLRRIGRPGLQPERKISAVLKAAIFCFAGLVDRTALSSDQVPVLF